jgi:hypothetical protein
MKFQKTGMIVIAAMVVIGGLAWMLLGNSKPKSVSPEPNEFTAISSPAPTAAAAAPTIKPSTYSEAFKAKVRSEFINACNVKGRQTIAVCNCTADFLAKNYTEAQLADFYAQYHATNKLSGDIEKAATNCGAK